MLDYLIRNALIVDGTGSEGFTGNIGIKDGKILGVGSLDGESGQVIDASHLVAVPGFIDMHSHNDLQYFGSPVPEQKIRQGITTELLGQDGLGVAPVSPDRRELIADLSGGLLGSLQAERWSWGSFGDYLNALETQGLPTNAAVLVSHAPIRVAVMGMNPQPAQPGDLRRMHQMTLEAMESGAYGLSTGLIYPPCSYANTEELIEVNRAVAKKGGIFVVHQRDEGYRLRQSFTELMQIAQNSGVHLHVSHLQAFGKVSWPTMDAVLVMADQLATRGGKISWDRYPYTAGCTVLTAVLPPFTTADSPKDLLKKLNEPAYRNRIYAEFQKGLEVWSNRAILLGWAKVLISSVESEQNRWMEGQDIETLAKRSDKDPVDFICDLLVEEKLSVKMISFYGSDEVLHKIMDNPSATVGTDGIFGGKPHPRLYGTFPRYFEKFVKQEKTFTLPKAVHKVTGLPAEILGLDKRGVLKEGTFADIVLMDMEQIADLATYSQPEQYPRGIEYVFVNGRMAVEGGSYTGSLSGQVLRKGRSG
jgi:N-acyl-D-amino-acid deacylase